ncbi:MAG TPA: hypothetical protein DEP69_07390, partial [Acidimicrobiaceae bacterium]|nr:hypothetical protein [Acidimicrobiaceae bacterium]
AAAAGALAEILGRIETDLGATRRELAQLVGRVAEVEQGRLTAVGPVEIRLSPETVDQLAAAVAALGPAAVGPSAAEPTPVETPPAGPASPRPEPDDDPAGPLTLDDLDDPFLEALIRQEPLVA